MTVEGKQEIKVEVDLNLLGVFISTCKMNKKEPRRVLEALMKEYAYSLPAPKKQRNSTKN
jgi:hypothetical protein